MPFADKGSPLLYLQSHMHERARARHTSHSPPPPLRPPVHPAITFYSQRSAQTWAQPPPFPTYSSGSTIAALAAAMPASRAARARAASSKYA
jgi:hypothetical protein